MTTIPSPVASELRIVYYPQLGCLVVLPWLPDISLEEQTSIQGLEYQFRTDSKVYFKNERMHELDNYLGNLW